MCVSSDGFDEIALLCRLYFSIQCSADEGSYTCSYFGSVFYVFDLLLVAYSHSLFQTSIILFDLLLVPVTVQLRTVFNQFYIFFFCKKSKSNHKVIVK